MLGADALSSERKKEVWSPLWCAVPVDHSLGLQSEHCLAVHPVECRTTRDLISSLQASKTKSLSTREWVFSRKSAHSSVVEQAFSAVGLWLKPAVGRQSPPAAAPQPAHTAAYFTVAMLAQELPATSDVQDVGGSKPCGRRSSDSSHCSTATGRPF